MRKAICLWIAWFSATTSTSTRTCHALAGVAVPSPAPQTAIATGTTAATTTTASLSNHAQPWKQAILDYEPANDYMEESYGIHNYFRQERNQPETVYNARHGVVVADNSIHHQNAVVPATLGSCGFQLVSASQLDSSDQHVVVTDWQDADQVRTRFLPRARHALLQAYASTIQQEGEQVLRDIVFWKPTERRGSNHFVAPVHIDMDVNAFASVDELLDFVWSCRIPEDDGDDTAQYETWKQALQNGARFCITNVWHNARADAPATQAPLGLLRTAYDAAEDCQVDEYGLCPSDYDALDSQDNDTHHPLDESTANDNVMKQEWPALPFAKPSPHLSKWYTFPDVTAEELLIFTQYDRDVRVTTDTWHCALTKTVDAESDDATVVPRHSFDVRCLVLLHERVPAEWDRWTPAHQMPLQEQ